MVYTELFCQPAMFSLTRGEEHYALWRVGHDSRLQDTSPMPYDNAVAYLLNGSVGEGRIAITFRPGLWPSHAVVRVGHDFGGGSPLHSSGRVFSQQLGGYREAW